MWKCQLLLLPKQYMKEKAMREAAGGATLLGFFKTIVHKKKTKTKLLIPTSSPVESRVHGPDQFSSTVAAVRTDDYMTNADEMNNWMKIYENLFARSFARRVGGGCWERKRPSGQARSLPLPPHKHTLFAMPRHRHLFNKTAKWPARPAGLGLED